MANLWITEFDTMPQAPLGKLPSVAAQVVSFSATTQSAALNANTNFVRVIADADCHIIAGDNPSATVSNMRLPSGAAEYFGVTPGQKIAVIVAA